MAFAATVKEHHAGLQRIDVKMDQFGMIARMIGA
jgi:hypothetical protein